MDLTPQTLRDVEFREKLRGYHPDDVDDFLEQAAVALEGLLNRLRTAEQAAKGGAGPAAVAAPSEPLAAEAPAAAPDEVTADTLHRTLLLAQRAADAAVAEAEESARRILDTAQEEAERIISDAEGRASHAAKDAKVKAEAAIVELEQRRSGLEREVTSLQSWAAQQRDRLRDVLTDQVRALDIWLATSANPKPSAARPTSLVNAAATGPAAAGAPASPPEDGAAPADEVGSPAPERG